MKPEKLLAFALLVLLASCNRVSGPAPAEDSSKTPAQPASPPYKGPFDEAIVTPPDNPITPEKIALGKQLFLDKRLSKSGKMSCESCHLPEKGWTDGLPLSTKDDGTVNTRHTPTLVNVAYYKEWYWDGRAKTLEGQVAAAWKNQMGATDADQMAMAQTLNGIEAYKRA